MTARHLYIIFCLLLGISFVGFVLGSGGGLFPLVAFPINVVVCGMIYYSVRDFYKQHSKSVVFIYPWWNTLCLLLLLTGVVMIGPTGIGNSAWSPTVNIFQKIFNIQTYTMIVDERVYYWSVLLYFGVFVYFYHAAFKNYLDKKKVTLLPFAIHGIIIAIYLLSLLTILVNVRSG